jgi:hypothetical protein
MWTMADHPIVTYWMRPVLHQVWFYRICPREENHFSIDLIVNSRSHRNLLQDIRPLEVESRESHLHFYSINSRQNLIKARFCSAYQLFCHFMKHISECDALSILALNLKFHLKIKSIFLSFKSFYVLQVYVYIKSLK